MCATMRVAVCFNHLTQTLLLCYVRRAKIYLLFDDYIVPVGYIVFLLHCSCNTYMFLSTLLTCVLLSYLYNSHITYYVLVFHTTIYA